MNHEEQKIVELLESKDKSNVILGYELFKSLDFDVSEEFKQKIYDMAVDITGKCWTIKKAPVKHVMEFLAHYYNDLKFAGQVSWERNRYINNINKEEAIYAFFRKLRLDKK